MKPDRILIICAHSDDHVIGAGGTILNYRKQGKKVTVAVLSYGERTHPWLKPEVAKKMRQKEAMKAGQILNCKTTFYDLKEGKFEKGYQETKEELVNLLKKEKPSKIFTHSDEDPHPDHRATLRIVKDLLETTKIKTEVYVFSVWNPVTIGKSNEPRMYVNIAPYFKEKLKALFTFTSQKGAIYTLLGTIFARNIKDGLHIGKIYAEKFYKII